MRYKITFKRRSNPYLLSYLALCVLLFLPINLHAKPCRDYKDDLDKAGSKCNWNKIEEIEDIANSTGDSCLQELVMDVKCSYFYSCTQNELDWAFKNCNMEKILAIQNLVKTEMTECATGFSMLERVTGIKCLYYDRCEKTPLETKVKNCDQNGFWESIDMFTSGVMADCPDYDSITRSLNRQKDKYFNRCIKSDMINASQNCNLEYLQWVEKIVKENFSKSAELKEIIALIAEFKCSHFDFCLASDIQDAAEKCDIKRIMKSEELLLSHLARKCTFDSETIVSLLNDAKTDYYENCADKEIKQAYNEEDWELISLVLKSLVSYPNIEAKHKFLRKKANIFSEIVRTKFKKGMESCDLDAIMKTETFFRQEKDIPNLGQIEEWSVLAKCGYFAHCVQEDLIKYRNTCNLNRILATEHSAKEIKGISGCVNVEDIIRESKCQYFLDCVEEDLDAAVGNCDEKRVSEIDGIVESGIETDCPSAQKLRGSVRKAKVDFFTKCTTKNIYKALDNCDLDGMIAYEKDIYETFLNNPDYSKVSTVVREIKCSYIDKCMKKEIEFLVHNCESDRIKKIEDIVENNMENCHNYRLYKTTILKVKEECSEAATKRPELSMNEGNLPFSHLQRKE